MKTNILIQKLTKTILFLALFTALLGCNLQGDSSAAANTDSELVTEEAAATIDSSNAPATSYILTGRVRADTGLAGANVSIGAISAVTDVNGFFEIANLSNSSADKWLVSIQKDGYVSTHKIVNLDAATDNYFVDVTMTAPDVTKQLDLSIEQSVTLNDDQISIVFPANAVEGAGVDAQISLTYGDPSSERGAAIFPGDYTATNNLADEAGILLESIGFVDISVTNAAGDDLTSLNQPATVTVRLPAIYQVGGEKNGEYLAGNTIAWWSYNEGQGVWLREDAEPATPTIIDDAIVTQVDNVLYASAKITHFSWWNLDRPIAEHACIKVQVIDSEGLPLAHTKVVAKGVSYNAQTEVVTDAEGFAAITVKRSLDSSAAETFSLYAEVGDTQYLYAVTAAIEGDVVTNILNSPTQIGSTVFSANDDACVSLLSPIVIEYKGSVSGVIYDEWGNPAQNVNLYNTVGYAITSDENGMFSFAVPLNVNINIFIPEQFSQEFVLSVDEPDLQVTINFINQAPVISSITVSPSGYLLPGDTVSLIANASDIEGDSLTYQWQTTQGYLSSASGKEVSLSLPFTATGSATISLTVTDGNNNASITRTSDVSWSQTSSTDDFIVQLTEPLVGAEVLEDITVILHGTDNISIEKIVISDALGVANFGQVDRNRVTVTVVQRGVFGLSTQLETIFNYNKKLLEVTAVLDYSALSCEENEIAELDLVFNNAPAAVVTWKVLGEEFEANGADQVITFCNNRLNVFSKVVAEGYDVNGELVAHSQVVAINAATGSLEFDMSHQPINIAIINNTAKQISASAINGQDFLTPISIDSDSADPITFLSLYDSAFEQVPNVISLQTHASNNDGSAINYIKNTSYTELPSSLVFNVPDFAITSFTRNALDNSFAWSLENAAAVDVLSIEISSWDIDNIATGQNLQWSLRFPPSMSSLKLPDLPVSITGAATTSSNVVDFNDFELSAIDVKEHTGYDEIDTTLAAQWFYIDTEEFSFGWEL